MSVHINKINGKIESISVFGDEVVHLIGLLQAMWADSPLNPSDEDYSDGIKALMHIIKEY